MAATQEPRLIVLGRKMRVVVKIVLVISFPFIAIWSTLCRFGNGLRQATFLAKCDVADDFDKLRRILRNDHPSFKDQESTDADHEQ